MTLATAPRSTNIRLKPSYTQPLTLAKSLPKPYSHVVYMDNFFTNVKLYMALKELGIGACGTAKNGSGFPPELLTFREILAKKKDWGMKAYSTVEDVLCLAWQDNNTVQLMTTVHTPSEMEAYDIVSKTKRHGIPAKTSIERARNLSFYTLPSVYANSQPYIERGLPFPTAVQLYNKHIGGSDGNAQARAYTRATVRRCDCTMVRRISVRLYNGAIIQWYDRTMASRYNGTAVRRTIIRLYTKVAPAESVVSKQVVAWHLVKTLHEAV